MIHIQNNQKAACNGKKREEKKNQLFRQELITNLLLAHLRQLKRMLSFLQLQISSLLQELPINGGGPRLPIRVKLWTS